MAKDDITDKRERSSPMIDGTITKDKFQDMFKRARERTSLSPTGLHYTIWKTMAEEDYSAEVLCVMMSISFVHGFACD